MTTKLFRETPHCKEFEADVVNTSSENEKIIIELNKTAFYPTSGGQYFDTGFLNDAKVLDVYLEDEKILHVIDKELDGKTVSGKIDWDRRFDNMQQHTGQHILSQSIIKIFKADTISSSLGNEFCTIDLDREYFSVKDSLKAEEEANRIIYENLNVNILYPSEDEMKEMPLRKMPPSDQKPRIVSIEGYDWSPCGGTHCATTGEVGLVKILRWGKMRGKIRLEFLCGRKALTDYQAKNQNINNLKGILSVQEDGLAEQAEKIITDLKEKQKEVGALKNQLCVFEVENLKNSAEDINGTKIIKKTYDDFSLPDLQNLAKSYSDPNSILLLTGKENAPAFVFAAVEADIDLAMLLNKARKNFTIKGGGAPKMVQGSMEKMDDLDKLTEFIYNEVMTLL